MHLRRKLTSRALLLTALYASSSMGEAAESASVTMARDRFDEGVEFFDAGRFEEARAAFLQAYALEPHPAVLLNIAQSELSSGHFLDAARRFAALLREPRLRATERRSAERGLSQARKHVSELRIAVDTPGAEVFVDDQSVGLVPLEQPLFVAPGPHRIRARRGSHTSEARVTAAASGSHDVELRLAPVEPEVTLDLVELATPPPSPPVIATEAPSFGRWLVASPVGVTGLVMTATGVILGTAGTIGATERYAAARDASHTIAGAAAEEGQDGTICESGSSTLARYQRACSERQRRLDQGDTWRALAIGGFVGAAAVAAGTTLYYFLGSPSAAPLDTARRRGPSLVPIVTTQVQGLSLTCAF